MTLFRTNTPIERHLLGRSLVFVKREDLYGIAPAPPLGKLRGLRIVLKKVRAKQVHVVGCWDTRYSYLGLGVAAVCAEMKDLQAILGYPVRKGIAEPLWVSRSRDLGAEILRVRGNHPMICHAQTRTVVTDRGGVMLPFGLDCEESVQEVAREAAQISHSLSSGTVVLSCGSGVSLAGILRGLPFRPARVIGISSGRSVSRIRRCVEKYVGQIPDYVEILPPLMPYDECPAVEAPFPCHPNYDLKAWAYLMKQIRRLEKPILFWNVGGSLAA